MAAGGSAALMTLLLALPLLAQEAAPEVPVSTLDRGDTAWMLTSTALVLMMTIPGLALFYGGMVRKMNVLATAMQSFAICCLVTMLWMVDRLQPGVHRRRQPLRRLQPHSSWAAWRRGGPIRWRRRFPKSVFMTLPDDLRHHHAGADRRRLRRPHEIPRHALVHGALAGLRLCADRPYGVGRRLARRLRRARLCRRHGGAYQCRRRRPRRGPRAGQAQGLSARCRSRRTTWSTA